MVSVQDHTIGYQSTHPHSFGQWKYILAQFVCSYNHATGYNDENTQKDKFTTFMTHNRKSLRAC